MLGEPCDRREAMPLGVIGAVTNGGGGPLKSRFIVVTKSGVSLLGVRQVMASPNRQTSTFTEGLPSYSSFA